MSKFKVAADTFIDKEHRGTVDGRSGQINLNDSATKKKYGLIYIPVTALSGAVVQTATLHLFLRGTGWSIGDIIYVDLLRSHRFHERDTWHTYNAYATADIAGADQASFTLVSADAGDEVSIEVQPLMADAAARTNFFGLLLSTDTGGDHKLHSSESQTKAYHPYLVMTYAQAPDAPTNLAPTRFASAAKPKFAWDTQDQAEFQVQISVTSDEFSLDADSGWIADDTTQVDTSDDGAWDTPWSTNIPTDGNSTAWRVRVRNTVGAESEWTDWTTYKRRVYGTVTITNPATNGDQVDDTIPDIEWTFTGTQTKFEVVISEAGFDSGRITGNDVIYGLLANTLTRKNTTYTVEVRVWDLYTRDAPGEAGYVLDTRTFLYDAGVTTTPVTALTAAQDGPAVALTWQRATAPDSFLILADDEVLVEGIDPDNAFVSGTTYSFRLLRAQQDTAISYSVRARDTATGDSPDPTPVVYTFKPVGVYLVYEPDDVEVEIMGQPNIDLAVMEDGATYQPIGQRAPIRVVDRIRGYGGEVQGQVGLADLANFRAIKAVPPGTLTEDNVGAIRLIFGGLNIPVDLEEVSVSEWPNAEGFDDDGRLFVCTFKFFQVSRPWPVAQ